MRLLVVIFLLLVGCREEPPGGPPPDLSLERVVRRLPARAGDPALVFSVELPGGYAAHGDAPSAHRVTYAGRVGERVGPQFTVGRASSPGFHLEPDGERSEGSEAGARWTTWVDRGEHSTVTSVEYVREAPIGTVVCSGSLDSRDSRAWVDWIVARCASLEVSGVAPPTP